MSIRSIYRSIYTLTISLSLVLIASTALAQVDTTRADTLRADTSEPKKVHRPEIGGHQVCIGIDIFHPITQYSLTDRHSTELEVDYYYKNQYYFVAEGGWGGTTVNYPDLAYTTSNNFLKLGVNKNLLVRDNPTDWDMMLIGIRLATSNIHRSSATYAIVDSVWGNGSGAVAGKDFPAYWLEIAGGMRVELFHGFMAGWTMRGKFLLNGKSFKDLAPLYIAGYGKGDKNSIFDATLFVSYAIRWRRPSAEAALLKWEKDKRKESE